MLIVFLKYACIVIHEAISLSESSVTSWCLGCFGCCRPTWVAQPCWCCIQEDLWPFWILIDLILQICYILLPFCVFAGVYQAYVIIKKMWIDFESTVAVQFKSRRAWNMYNMEATFDLGINELFVVWDSVKSHRPSTTVLDVRGPRWDVWVEVSCQTTRISVQVGDRDPLRLSYLVSSSCLILLPIQIVPCLRPSSMNHPHKTQLEACLSM